MIDIDESINIVEFNSRFGDPETQIVLPQLETDLVDIFIAMTKKELDKIQINWKNQPTICVVIASDGYPNSYEKHKEIKIGDLPKKTKVIYAAAYKENGLIKTNGGRVLSVVGQGETLKDAVDITYQAIQNVKFDGAFYRSDIGHKAL